MRTFSFIALLIAALGSFGLMLYAGRNQQSLLLTALFAGWVLAPFAAAVLAYSASRNWKMTTRRTLHSIALIVAAGSLAIYGAFGLGTLRAKAGFIFLVVPAATWLVSGLALGWAALKSR